jgi:hypothetical protein
VSVEWRAGRKAEQKAAAMAERSAGHWGHTLAATWVAPSAGPKARQKAAQKAPLTADRTAGQKDCSTADLKAQSSAGRRVAPLADWWVRPRVDWRGGKMAATMVALTVAPTELLLVATLAMCSAERSAAAMADWKELLMVVP